jgi:hypothetical protein
MRWRNAAWGSGMEKVSLREDDTPQWKRWLARGVWAALLIAMVVAAGRAWQVAQKVAPPHYLTREARRGSLTVTVTATGTLQPTNQVDVSSELSGIIRSVEVGYNAQVQVGQILARLDTVKLQAQGLRDVAAFIALPSKGAPATLGAPSGHVRGPDTRIGRRPVVRKYSIHNSCRAGKLPTLAG